MNGLSDDWDPLADDDLPSTPRKASPRGETRPRSDLAWSVPDEDDESDDLELLPIDEEVFENRRRVAAAEIPAFEPEEEEETPTFAFRFTMRHLLAGVTAAAVVLGASTWVKEDYLAGVLGGLVLLGLVALSLTQDVEPGAKKAWWALLGIYLFACLIAAASQ